MGQSKMAFISRKDCALAATHALINQCLHREVLNINGLELLTIDYFITLLETLYDISLKAEYIADDIYLKNKMGEEK